MERIGSSGNLTRSGGVLALPSCRIRSCSVVSESRRKIRSGPGGSSWILTSPIGSSVGALTGCCGGTCTSAGLISQDAGKVLGNSGLLPVELPCITGPRLGRSNAGEAILQFRVSGPELFSWAVAAEPGSRKPTAKKLAAIRTRILRPRRVIRWFLCNGYIMGMTLLHRSRAHQDKARFGA